MCHCVGVGVAVGVTEMGPPAIPKQHGGPIPSSAKGSLEQAQTSTASTRANKNMAGRKTRPHALLCINRLPGAGSRETGAQNSTGGAFMKDTPSSRTPSQTRTSLNIMFFLLMIVYSPCAWPALALAADSEPMVSLPGGVPPQASQLLAAATPAPADMLLSLRIYRTSRRRA